MTSSGPQLFALPPGVDFGRAVVDGLIARHGSDDPASIARIELFVNTRRMQRRIRAAFAEGPARLLPRLRLITDIGQDPAGPDLPPATSALRRRLDMMRLVEPLLSGPKPIAPLSALYGLADGLARVLDEFQGEGVPLSALDRLDVTDLSGHWQHTRAFLSIIARYLDEAGGAPDSEERQRRAVLSLIARWAIAPPAHPVIVAGSTGSRGTTALLLEAVARLPKGAVILPGFDFDMPEPVWDALDDPLTGEDHPQFRFRKLLGRLELRHGAVQKWTEAAPANPLRNRLVSLSLRPAPVTDQWLRDSPSLGQIGPATEGLTLLEAPTPRDEALAIALRLRAAAEAGQTAALITPDRTLSRQVAAALDRWDIVPDDSAGEPLGLTAPGRLLRMIAREAGKELSAAPLLQILSHPLVAGSTRDSHLLRLLELELFLRKQALPRPEVAQLLDWASKTEDRDPGRGDWVLWFAKALAPLSTVTRQPLSQMVALHRHAAETLAAGPGGEGTGGLWQEAPGREALQLFGEMEEAAEAGPATDAAGYVALFDGLLAGKEVRRPDSGHPGILFWGTLEARVQSVALVILAGLNEGSWPETPAPDPWLNRRMRKDLGLLLPERQIGLSAHDYQQAIAAPEVWLTRSIRSSDAETVPSRWLNRLCNLLAGIPAQGGPEALARCRAEGNRWLMAAREIEKPEGRVPPAPRPAPAPPASARPSSLSVTQIEKLIRDPYAIYAEKILRLMPLDPIEAEDDPRRRGIILHRIFERFVAENPDTLRPGSAERLAQIADEELARDCPWPGLRRLWGARFAQTAARFFASEAGRRANAAPEHVELRGKLDIRELDFQLTGVADRIDRADDGTIRIYDYKSGITPTENQQKYFSQQLFLLALMAESGGFAELGPTEVAGAGFVALGSGKDQPADLAGQSVQETLQRLTDLLRSWASADRPYVSRARQFKDEVTGNYDHLARFGEWQTSDEARPEPLT